MNTTWTITQCEHRTSDGFITAAHWNCTAIDGLSAGAYGSCSFAAATPAIPYDSVTEQEVLNWCWANGVDKDATEARLAASIELQRNPVVASGVPWATT